MKARGEKNAGRKKTGKKNAGRKRARRKSTARPDAALAEAMQAHRDAFVKKFGREPGPEDPLFFDPDSDTPRPIRYDEVERAMIGAMVAAGIDARVIYAFRRTGLVVTELNLEHLSRRDLREWQAALEEYDRLVRTSH